LHPLLHRRGDIAQSVPGPDLLNSFVQRFACYSQEVADLGANLADRKRHRRISIITIQLDAEVEGNNVSLFQAARPRGYPVNHLLIDGGAQHTWITAVAFKRRAGAMFLSALS